MRKLAIWDSAVETWRIVLANAGRFARLFWPWLLVVLAAQAVSAVGSHMVDTLMTGDTIDDDTFDGRPLVLAWGLLAFAGWVGGVVASVPIATATIRWVLQGPQASAPFGRREGWYLLGFGMTNLLALVPTVLAVVIVPLMPGGVLMLILLAVTMTILALPVLARLFMAVVPAALGEARVDLLGAWWRTYDNGPRIIASGVVATMPFLIAYELPLGLASYALAGDPPPHSPWSAINDAALQYLMMVPMLALWPALFAVIHRRLTETDGIKN